MIVHLADYAPEYTGNFIYSIISLSQEYKEKYAKEVLVIFPIEANKREWIELLKKNDINVGFVDKQQSKKKRINKIIQIINETGSETPKIIHTHFAGFELDSISLKKYYSCKLIWHMHMGLLKIELKHKLYDLYKLRYMFNNHVDCMIAVSEHVKKLMIKRGCDKNKIKVILNGIYTEKHQISLNRRYTMRKKLGILDDELAIIMFGYSPIIKGVDVLLNSIDDNSKNIKYIFIGGDPMKSFIINHKKYLKYKDNIIIAKSQEDVSDFYNVADVFACCSRTEAFPYAIGEAMLYGLPIIVSDIEGPNFYHNAGKGVNVFKNENFNDLNSIICNIQNKFIQNKRLLTNENIKFVKENLSINNWVFKIMQIYEYIN